MDYLKRAVLHQYQVLTYCLRVKYRFRRVDGHLLTTVWTLPYDLSEGKAGAYLDLQSEPCPRDRDAFDPRGSARMLQPPTTCHLQ